MKRFAVVLGLFLSAQFRAQAVQAADLGSSALDAVSCTGKSGIADEATVVQVSRVDSNGYNMPVAVGSTMTYTLGI